MFKDIYNNLTDEDKLLFSLLVDMQQLSYLMSRRNSNVIKAVQAFYDEQSRNRQDLPDHDAASEAKQENNRAKSAPLECCSKRPRARKTCEGKEKGSRGKRKPHEVSSAPESEATPHQTLNSKK